MSWPTNPSNGQQVTKNGIAYRYNSTSGVWERIGQSVVNLTAIGTVTSNYQPNITAVGTMNALSVTGNVSSGGNVIGTHYGNGYNLSGLFGSNVLGQVSNSLISGTVYSNSQPNITSIGALTSLNVNGNASAGNLLGNGYYLSGLFGSNVIGIVASATSATNATTAGTVTTNAQPNITSVGTLTSLNVSGNVSSGGNILGNGYYLSGLFGSNVLGQVSNALVSGTVYNPAQPNITSLGTLSGVSVSGNATITGNLIVGGTAQYTNVNNLYIQDPIIEIGGGANAAPLVSNDSKDRGALLHYYTTRTVDAFMGWDNSNAEFAFGSNVTMSSDVATFNSFGNVRANYFLGANVVTSGSIDAFGNVTASRLVSNVATGTAPFTVSSATRVNNLNVAYANVSDFEVVTAQNTGTFYPVFISGSTTANYALGANSLINVSVATGTFNASLVGGTLTTASQPNITSLGTVSALTISGNLSTQGWFTAAETQEILSTISGATGTVTHNLLNGATFYHTGAAANFTANFTNVPTTTDRTTIVTLVIAQGATAYLPTAVQIDGVSQTIKWASGAAPGGTANGVDVVSFALVRQSSTWVQVLGSYSAFA